MSSQGQAPFDGKMILAIGITIAVWVGYQSYLHKKYPEAYQQKQEQTQAPTEASAPATGGDVAEGQTVAPGEPSQAGTSEPRSLVVKEEYLDLEDENWSVRFSSRGLGVATITLKNHSDREGRPVTFSGTDGALNFETNLQGRREPLFFQIKKSAENQVLGEAQIGNMKVTKIVTLDSSKFDMDVQVRVENPEANFLGLTTTIADQVLQASGGSFLTPAYEYTEFFIHHEGTEDRLHLAVGTQEKETYDNVSIAAIATQYFALAFVDKSKVAPEFRATTVVRGQEPNWTTAAVGTVTHSMVNKADQFNIGFKTYAGPKSWDLLEQVDSELTSLVNFGFFKTIAKWIFRLLQAIHAAVGNWGFAIVLLTVLVRVLVLPFNIMSYKSMKAMAKVQPQMKLIREKYKDQPQKANEEIMKLMRDAKANPLGGCLPMLLQIPVFFALYQVLGQSIELYKAPFIFWIHDLSAKDPYFVLPVLMGATMFVQQKITPSTMEPAQQKILMFMPIFLTFLLATLPSGLTLYMFVSTLFGVLQQLYFMKDDKKPVSN